MYLGIITSQARCTLQNSLTFVGLQAPRARFNAKMPRLEHDNEPCARKTKRRLKRHRRGKNAWHGLCISIYGHIARWQYIDRQLLMLSNSGWQRSAVQTLSGGATAT